MKFVQLTENDKIEKNKKWSIQNLRKLIINELQGSPQTVKQFAPTGKLENKNIAINKELKNISKMDLPFFIHLREIFDFASGDGILRSFAKSIRE